MICLFVDALNPNYLNYMPFLNSVKGGCLHGYLEVPLGYTGNIASFVSGVWPDKHKIFDLFVPDETPKNKINSKYLLGLIRLLQNKRLFFTPPKTKAMKYFKTSLDKNWAQKDCLNYPTVFDLVERSGKSFESIDWPNYFVGRKAKIFFSNNMENVLKLTLNSSSDFILAHFLDLEKAHILGVDSLEIKDICKGIDNSIKKLWEKDKNILIFSDHGMDNFEKEVDIGSEIKKLGLKFGQDFLYVIGSTSVEFWFKNKDAKKKVIELLKNLKYGKIVNQKEFHLNTGSLIFLADFKTGFYPNFFSEKRLKAMHGWNPKEQKSYYVLKNSLGKTGRKDAKMVDFLPTILKLMGLHSVRVDGKPLV